MHMVEVLGSLESGDWDLPGFEGHFCRLGCRNVGPHNSCSCHCYAQASSSRILGRLTNRPAALSKPVACTGPLSQAA